MLIDCPKVMKTHIRNACRFLLLSLLAFSSVFAQMPQMTESSRLMDSGVKLYNAGNLDGAIAAFRQSIAASPKNAMAHFNLGLVLADKGDWRTRLRHMNKPSH
jgi:tetratricopeptide (TPR) repeat protein